MHIHMSYMLKWTNIILLTSKIYSDFFPKWKWMKNRPLGSFPTSILIIKQACHLHMNKSICISYMHIHVHFFKVIKVIRGKDIHTLDSEYAVPFPVANSLLTLEKKKEKVTCYQLIILPPPQYNIRYEAFTIMVFFFPNTLNVPILSNISFRYIAEASFHENSQVFYATSCDCTSSSRSISFLYQVTMAEKGIVHRGCPKEPVSYICHSIMQRLGEGSQSVALYKGFEYALPPVEREFSAVLQDWVT